MKDNKVSKKYLARVMGNFPCTDEKEVEVDKSIWCVSPKLSKYDYCKTPEEEEKGKTAKTVFKKLWYDEKSNTSLVECRPVTGRTHQIRIHCMYLGHSIVNDRNYGGVFVGNLIEDAVLRKAALLSKQEKEEQEKASNDTIINSSELIGKHKAEGNGIGEEEEEEVKVEKKIKTDENSKEVNG